MLDASFYEKKRDEKMLKYHFSRSQMFHSASLKKKYFFLNENMLYIKI